MSFGASVVAAVCTYVFAPALADIFASGKDVATVTDVLRAISPFVAFSSVYSVLCYGTRGFNTMVPQVCIEKIGRALAQPIAVLAVILLGGGVVAATYAWAAVQMVWILPAAIAYFHLLRRTERRPRNRARVSRWRSRAPSPRTACRVHLGRCSRLAVLWMDTLIISAILGTTDAGIYAAGTRYLLIGLFTAEAIMQVIGPRIKPRCSRFASGSKLPDDLLHRRGLADPRRHGACT